MHKIIALAFTLIISGCVGISNIKSIQKEKKVNLSSEIGYLSYGGKKNYTKSKVISLWGEPDDIRIKNNTQHWIYNREVAFNGILIWVIVPIPLVIPTGYRTTKLVFEKENVSKIIYEDTRLPTAFCGLPTILLDATLCGILD